MESAMLYLLSAVVVSFSTVSFLEINLFSLDFLESRHDANCCSMTAGKSCTGPELIFGSSRAGLGGQTHRWSNALIPAGVCVGRIAVWFHLVQQRSDITSPTVSLPFCSSYIWEKQQPNFTRSIHKNIALQCSVSTRMCLIRSLTKFWSPSHEHVRMLQSRRPILPRRHSNTAREWYRMILDDWRLSKDRLICYHYPGPGLSVAGTFSGPKCNIV